MPGRRKDIMDIRELLRHIRATQSDRQVQAATDIDRRTVKKYRAWAKEQGLLEGPLPSVEELQQRVAESLPASLPPQNVSTVERYREVVKKLRESGAEISAVYERLKERGYTGQYASVRRFVRQLEPQDPEATVRVERAPGEEGQVDFGSAGQLIDPRSGQPRRAWEFVLTLSYSRHQYVEFVFDQTVRTWLACHTHAFEFFGGVPQRLVVDNLKAGITQASWDDPQVQQSYRECAEHYGFLVAPCRPRTPEHKGKVEQGGVHYVKRNFLAGREITTLTQANQDVRTWCLTTAGQRVHGTTQERPLDRFETEQAYLLPLPATAYDPGEWKMLKLHRDCHVVFDRAFYSAPFSHIGQSLRVRGGAQQVRIYSQDYQLLATHDRAERPGMRFTHPEHLPPEKVPGWLLDRAACREEATGIGPATLEVVSLLLDDPVIDRLATVGRLLRLRQRFGNDRLEAACRRALHFQDPSYPTIKRILSEDLDQDDLPQATPIVSPAHTFVRSVVELVGSALGGVSWN